MIRIVRGNHILVVENSIARMIRKVDNVVVLTASNAAAVEALIDCFSEDIKNPNRVEEPV